MEETVREGGWSHRKVNKGCSRGLVIALILPPHRKLVEVRLELMQFVRERFPRRNISVEVGVRGVSIRGTLKHVPG